MALPGDFPIGESWELSLDATLPSRVEGGRTLADVVAEAPRAWTGGALEDAELLVKLLDADDDLSVQVHPADGDPRLGPTESGKPECWYVVDASPGAAIYLGFSAGVTRRGVEDAVRGPELARCLHRVEVQPGDFFVIPPGTPHAVGRGVFVVEPQRVRPGRSGVTYRFYDWDRTYDSTGRVTPHGARRTLHVEAALAVVDFDGPRAEALLRAVHRRTGPARAGDARVEWLAGAASGGLPTPDFRVARLSGTGTLRASGTGLRAVTVLDGEVEADGVVAGPGRTLALPSVWDGALTVRDAHAILSEVPGRAAR